jgi:hypothetical protein
MDNKQLTPRDDDQPAPLAAFNALPATVKGAVVVAAGSAAFVVNRLLKRGMYHLMRSAVSSKRGDIQTVRGEAQRLSAGMVRVGKTTFKRLPDGTVLEEGTVYMVQYIHSGDEPLIVRIKNETS